MAHRNPLLPFTLQNRSQILDQAINLIAQGTRVEGKVTFEQVSRVHGTLMGEVRAKEGSTLILSETAVVEGTIEADSLWIDGYVHGDIEAHTRVVISRTGRVIGNIKTPSLVVEFGAYFEGRCLMESSLSGGGSQRNQLQ